MGTKLIASTEIQNNFGRILDDVARNGTRYVVRRHSISQAIILSLTDFEEILLAGESERQRLGIVLRELAPEYSLGEVLEES